MKSLLVVILSNLMQNMRSWTFNSAKIANITIIPTNQPRIGRALNQSIMSTVTLTAYNVKTKEKNVPIQDAVITKTAKGAYMAQGNDGKGNKLTTLLGEEKALAAIKAGIAKQGW